MMLGLYSGHRPTTNKQSNIIREPRDHHLPFAEKNFSKAPTIRRIAIPDEKCTNFLELFEGE